MFYPNGEFIPYQMPQDFRASKKGEGSCGSCGLYSNKHGFCGVFKSRGVKDTYVCSKWRRRFFKR